MNNQTLNIAQATILNKFNSLKPKDIEIDFDGQDDLITVTFPMNDEFDLSIVFDSFITYPDDYSILCERTKFKESIYVSQYDSDLDYECNVDLSFMLRHIENFIFSKEYKSDLEVFFDKDSVEKSWSAEKEYSNPMRTYGLSNSDFT